MLMRMPRRLVRRLPEERRIDCLLRSLNESMLAASTRAAHHREAHAEHNGPNIGEVAVTVRPGVVMMSAIPCTACRKNVIGNPKRLVETRALRH